MVYVALIGLAESILICYFDFDKYLSNSGLLEYSFNIFSKSVKVLVRLDFDLRRRLINFY